MASSPPEYVSLQEGMPKPQETVNQPGYQQQQVQLPDGSHIPLGAYPPPSHPVPPVVTALPTATSGNVVQSPPQQPGPSRSRQSSYKPSAGVITGIMHLSCGFLAIIFSGASFVFPPFGTESDYYRRDYDYYYSPRFVPLNFYTGMGIWSAILFFIPTGILGLLSKRRISGVIVAYLVMCILTAVNSGTMAIYESTYASYYPRKTSLICGYSDYYGGYGSSCSYRMVYVIDKPVIALHSILAIIAFVEFVAAIVGAAFCCNGLCCDGKKNPAYYNCTFVQPEPALTQPQPHVIQVARAN